MANWYYIEYENLKKLKLNALSCRPSEEIIKHQANFLSETGKKWKGLKNTVKLI